MKRILLIAFVIILFKSVCSQPSLVNSSPYGQISQLAFDSLHQKLYVNFLYGCPTWNTPCAYSYTLYSQHNLVNKHNFSDNTLSTVESSKYQTPAPSYPINNYNSGMARGCVVANGALFTNFGYHFNKRDTSFSNVNPVWSYSPALNPSFKEISVFELKGDSVICFEKDSTSGTNYYTAFILNSLTGSDIPYNSIHATTPFSMIGSIKGIIRKSVRINNHILLAGTFTASILGTPVAQNIVSFNIATGGLESVPLNFSAGTDIYDMKLYRNKIWIAGKFQNINNLPRKNFAVLNTNFSLASETLSFEGAGPPSQVFVDAFEWYHDYLIAKGNFNAIKGNLLSSGNNYWVKVFNTKDSLVMPWNISLPGTPLVSDYMFQMFRQKLYIKNRSSYGSPVNIYCFPPVNTSPEVSVNGITTASLNMCVPGAFSCTAPFRYAESFNWNYSGTGITVQTIGNGEHAIVTGSIGATSGTLSVSAYNDCGLTTQSATLYINVNNRPDAIPSSTLQQILCNPDSLLLSGTTSAPNSNLFWRETSDTFYFSPPHYTKTSGNFYLIALDTLTGCSDSSLIVVTENKAIPNAFLLSHAYTGVAVPVDTITCFQPLVNINGGTDTAGTTISWRRLQNDSLFSNPLTAASGGYYKLIVTRNNNGCADSSMLVLIAENKTSPTVNVAEPSDQLNCSNYNVLLNAHINPGSSTAEWYDTLSLLGQNPVSVNAPGKYRIKVINPVNGCVAFDSITLVSTGNFYFSSSPDTMVCKQSLVSLQTNVTGTMSNVSYSWNGIPGASSMSFQPSQTTSYIVSAVSGTCSGTDTIEVIIPPDIMDSVSTIKSCSDPTSGTIVVFASGGKPPYAYSINGGNVFNSSSTFSNIPFGIYNIVIRDSMNCIRQTTTSLDAFSNLPQPKWLSSTLNTKNDTLVLVDISIPKPDSVQWIFPLQVSMVGGDMFNPVITMADTGSVKVIMKAFYGACIINSEKWIHFGETDSSKATLYNDHGIQTFIIYPNPNAGLFNVMVQFLKSQNAVLQIWNNNGTKLLQENYYDVLQINSNINMQHLQNGNYYLRIISEFDSAGKTFIINK